MSSKLRIIRSALDTNREISVVADIPISYFPARDGHEYLSQIVKILIAPRRELYTAEELQSLMLGLLPGIKPTYKVDFKEYPKNPEEVGVLAFDEIIGQERVELRRTVALTDYEVEVPNSLGLSGPQVFVSDNIEKILRRTLLLVYPNETVVRCVLDGRLPARLEYNFPLDKMNDYREQEPLLKVVGK